MRLTTLYGPCLFVCNFDVFCVSYCTNTYELIGKFVVYGLFFDRVAITYISCSSWFFWAICIIRSWAAISFLTCSWTDSSPLVGPGAVRKCRSWLTEFPKIISVGDTPVLVLIWVFKIRCTYGKYFGQFDLRSWSEIIAVRCRITSWFARSTIPFSSWLYGCIVLWSRPVWSKNDLIKSLKKYAALSDTSSVGTPKRAIHWFNACKASSEFTASIGNSFT